MKRVFFVFTSLALAATFAAADEPGANPGLRGTALASGDGVFFALTDEQFARGELWLEVFTGGWKKPGAWMNGAGAFEPDGAGATGRVSAKLDNGAELFSRIRVTPEGKRAFHFECETGITQDAEFHQFLLVMRPGLRMRGAGRGTISCADGERTVNPNSVSRDDYPGLKKYAMRDADGAEALSILFPDGGTGRAEGNHFHFVLAAGALKAGETRAARFTVTLPFDADGLFTKAPQPANFDRWFPWRADSDTAAESAFDRSGEMERPAGRHGRIVSDGHRLVYNGQPIKLWGLNNCYREIFPDREMAGRRAAFYAKYGVNAVRFHKWCDVPGWGGIQTRESAVAFDEEAAAKMDYYMAALKEKGIYVKLSANFGNITLGRADAARFPETEALGAWQDGLLRTPHAALWLVPAVQTLQIEQVCNLLKRRNTVTGLAYGEDPAVFMVELANENDALFYAIWGGCAGNPYLKRLAGEQFAAWLHEKYGTEEKLLAAWGETHYGGVPDQGTEGESWDLVYPAGNPWYWNDNNVTDGRRPRLLDAALFWYGVQKDFYARFVKAIREAGYDGEILGSNWQAGDGYAHYLNLHSDSLVGLIDRHNYFGNSAIMLSTPGSGSLSSGMNQQVIDRPFMLSEWAHAGLNEFYDEGPTLIGAYGMGLNGWDVSFWFENGDQGKFSEGMGSDFTNPSTLGVMPAVSRMVTRRDVAESELLFTRHVHLPSLMRGELDFNDALAQGYDDKSFESETLSPQLLAVGRMVVAFSDDEKHETVPVSPARFLEDGRLVSSTGQLRWRPGQYGRDGHVEIDTPRTQAVSGFTRGAEITLADVAVRTTTPYATIYVTSLDDNAGVGESRRLLVTAMARMRNTGMETLAGKIIRQGGGPVLAEPVEAVVTFRRGGSPTVNILDLDGRRTGKTLPARDGVFAFDTAESKTVYFEVVY
ncbi:MAG: hypothetical protein FWF96_01210 [Kiritimatiellaeota bacterium]|nr:hypothetical protein [Kiritimatiellota bacterium]